MTASDSHDETPMRLAVASTRRRVKALFCSVLTREFCHCIARSPSVVEPHCLPSGLHDLGAERMSARLQEEIDRIDDGEAEAIVLGYGLCNNGLVGLRARRTPLVVARAHDCVTWLLGSKERYREVFDAEPGTYFFTPGWVESPPEAQASDDDVLGRLGMRGHSFEALAEQYGEENARFLMETMNVGCTHYKRYLWITSELGAFPELESAVERLAERDGMRFERERGGVGLIQRALDGDWNDEDFVVCPPGYRLEAKVASGILQAAPAEGLSSD